jgi:hypothetical protein
VSGDGASTTPSNPLLLICDTDAAAQILLAGNVSALRELKRVYRIQPAIVEAVDFELRSPQGLSLKKLMPKYEAALEKALGNGTIQVLDERSLPAFVGATAHAVWTEVAIRATRWAMRVQRGEAYSHSMALSLRLPMVTHDISAITILEKDGETLSTPLLRVFDLYAFGVQCGCMNDSDCDACRQVLYREQEFIPKAFKDRSFKAGLEYFYPRLQCTHHDPVGHPTPIDPHDVRLAITPVSAEVKGSQ